MFSPLHKSLVQYMKDEMSFDNLVGLHNAYVSDMSDGDSYVMEHCTDLITQYGMSGEEAMRALYFGHVDNWNDYVKFNGYGNLESVYNWENLPVELDALAQWLLDYGKLEFTVHLELGDNEWECYDNDTDICDKEMMARWVSDAEDDEADREAWFDELMRDGHWWVEWHSVEAN